MTALIIKDKPISMMIAAQNANHITVVVDSLRNLPTRKPVANQKTISEVVSAFLRNGERAKILNRNKPARNMPHAKQNWEAAE